MARNSCQRSTISSTTSCLEASGVFFSFTMLTLVGASLWAARRILENDNDSSFAFPLYTKEKRCNANSASAALNKWLRNRLGEGNVIHGFRHSMRDRLRAVECPSDLIDQIGGWTKRSVGEGYGKGYDIKVMLNWLDKVNLTYI